jgi:hypothetical protein
MQQCSYRRQRFRGVRGVGDADESEHHSGVPEWVRRTKNCPSLSLEDSGIDEFKILESDLVDIAGAVVVLKNILDFIVIDRIESLKTTTDSYVSEAKQ